MAVPSPSIPSTSGSPLRVQLPSSSSGPSAISGSYRRPPSQLPRPGVEVVRFLPDTFRGLAGSRLRKKHKQTPVMARSAASGMARVSQSPKSTEPSFGPNAFPTLPLSSVFVSLRRPCSCIYCKPSTQKQGRGMLSSRLAWATYKYCLKNKNKSNIRVVKRTLNKQSPI